MNATVVDQVAMSTSSQVSLASLTPVLVTAVLDATAIGPPA